MDRTTLLMSGFSQPLPVTSSASFPHQMKQAPNVGATHPALFSLFTKQMEAPVANKSSSLLEMHYQEQQQLLDKETARMRSGATHPQNTSLSAFSESTPPTSASTLASSSSEPSTAPDMKAAAEPTPDPFLPQTQTRLPAQTRTQTQAHSTTPSAAPNDPLLSQAGLDLFGASYCSDPRYTQMVSRMAAYYQQRCQAILNFQQQRCQTWAATHRQKCHDSMQAAMLVVAWYVRDRIGRRKRRSNRSFRNGLRDKNYQAAIARKPGGRVKKGESVRKWVTEIPDVALSPSNGSRDDDRLDQEEREFDVEKEVPRDKESQLFAVADQMIKSQLAKIDVPLLGALNLEDSDCESDSDDDIRFMPQDCDMDDDDDDDEDEDEEDDYEYEDEVDPAVDPLARVEDGVSKEALNGTGSGSRKRKRSESII